MLKAFGQFLRRVTSPFQPLQPHNLIKPLHEDALIDCLCQNLYLFIFLILTTNNAMFKGLFYNPLYYITDYLTHRSNRIRLKNKTAESIRSIISNHSVV